MEIPLKIRSIGWKTLEASRRLLCFVALRSTPESTRKSKRRGGIACAIAGLYFVIRFLFYDLLLLFRGGGEGEGGGETKACPTPRSTVICTSVESYQFSSEDPLGWDFVERSRTSRVETISFSSNTNRGEASERFYP